MALMKAVGQWMSGPAITCGTGMSASVVALLEGVLDVIRIKKLAMLTVVTDTLNYCHQHKGLRTNAYVIIPTHIHGVFFFREFNPPVLKDALTDFRKFTGRQLSDYCERHMPGCFSKVLHEAAPGDRARRFWQPSQHPEQIESESFWMTKVNYLHENPCRKGLVTRQEHWRFSSAMHWSSDAPVANDVILSALDW